MLPRETLPFLTQVNAETKGQAIEGMQQYLVLLQWLAVTQRYPWGLYLRMCKLVTPLRQFIDSHLPQYIPTVEWKIDEEELESLLFTVGHAAEEDWM